MNSRYLCLTLAAALAVPFAPCTSAQTDTSARAQSPTGGESAKHKKVFVRKASDVTGSTVLNAKGEEVGEIQDLVVEPNTGRIQYAVLSIGGFLGMGDKLYGVPWSKFEFPMPTDAKPMDPEAGRQGEVGETGDETGMDENARGMRGDRPDAILIVIDVDKAQLQSAPSFTKEAWPKTDAKWEQQIGAHYGTQAPRAGAQEPRALIRLEDLRGTNVVGQGDEEIGEIGNVALDTTEGRIAFYVLDFGGALGIGETHYVLPPEVVDVRLVEDELVFSAPMLSEERLDQAPEFDEDDWERMSNPIWLREVYAFWNQDPYWTRAVEAGYRKPKSGDAEQDDERDL